MSRIDGCQPWATFDLSANSSAHHFRPDFPDTWKKLSPELKHVANRRMAIDAAEADVDVGGAMSYVTGAKLAFTDGKVCR